MSGGYFNLQPVADQRRQPVSLPFAVIDSIANSLPPIPSVDGEAGELARRSHIVKTRNALMRISMIPDQERYEQLKKTIHSKYQQSLIPNDQRVGMFAAETLSNGAYQVTMDTFSVAGQDLMIGAGLRNIEALYNVQLDRNDPKVIVHFDPAYGRAPSYHFTQNDVVDMRAQLVQMTVENFIIPDGIEIAPFEPFDGDNVSDDLRQLRNSTMQEMSMNPQPVGWWDRLFMISDPNGHVISDSISVMRVKFDVTMMYAHRVTLQMIVDTISLYGKIAAEDLIMVQSSFTEGIIDFMTGEDFKVLQGAAGYESVKGASRGISELLFFTGILKPHFRNLKVKGVTALTELNPAEVNVMSAINGATRAVKYQVARHGFEMMKKNLRFEADHETFINQIFEVNKRDLNPEDLIGDDPKAIDIVSRNDRVIIYPLKELNISKVPLLPDEVIKLELAEFYNPGEIYSDVTEEAFYRTWVIALDHTTIRIKGVAVRDLLQILKLAGVKILHEIKDELLLTHTGEIYVESAEDPVRLMEAYLNSAYNLSRIFDITDGEIMLKSQGPIISSATIKSILLTADLTTDHPVPGTVAEITERLRSGMSRNESYEKEDRFTVTTLKDHISIRFKKNILPVPTSYFHDIMRKVIEMLRSSDSEILEEVSNTDLSNLQSQIILSAGTMSQQRTINFLKNLLAIIQIKENYPVNAKENFFMLEDLLGERYGSFFKVDTTAVQITVNDYRENIIPEVRDGILKRAGLVMGQRLNLTREKILEELQKSLVDPHAKIYQKYVYAVATVIHPALAKKQLFKSKEKISVYKSLMLYPWIDRKKTISNDLREIQRSLGVEASRNYFLYELTQTLAAFKVTPNIRHVLTAADFIYRMGYPVGLSRSGISQHRIGFMSEAIVGNSAQQLSKSYQRDDESVSHIGPATVLGAISLVRSRHPELIAESRKRATRDALSKANKLQVMKERLDKRALSFELDGNHRYYTDDAPTLNFLPNGEIEEVDNLNKILAVDIKDDDTEAEEYLRSAELGVTFYNEVDTKTQESVPVITMENLPKIPMVSWKKPEYSGLNFKVFLDLIFGAHMEKAMTEVRSSKDVASVLEKSIRSANHSYGFGDLECLDDMGDFVDVSGLYDLLSRRRT